MAAIITFHPAFLTWVAEMACIRLQLIAPPWPNLSGLAPEPLCIDWDQSIALSRSVILVNSSNCCSTNRCHAWSRYTARQWAYHETTCFENGQYPFLPPTTVTATQTSYGHWYHEATGLFFHIYCMWSCTVHGLTQSTVSPWQWVQNANVWITSDLFPCDHVPPALKEMHLPVIYCHLTQ